MRRSITAVLSALVLALSMPVQPADGSAATWAQTPASTDLEDAVTQDAAEGVTSDLEAVREAQGWTTKQLAAYEASEAALDAVTERLSTDYPDAFIGSALAADPTQPPTVYVKGRAPAEIRALASELGVAFGRGATLLAE